MRIKLTRATVFTALGLALALANPTSLVADGHIPANAEGGVTMELIGQAKVLSPQAAIQYGYLSYIAGLETIFSGTPKTNPRRFLRSIMTLRQQE